MAFYCKVSFSVTCAVCIKQSANLECKVKLKVFSLCRKLVTVQTPTDKPEANGALILQGHPTTVFCKNNCWKKQESTRVFYSLSKANNF